MKLTTVAILAFITALALANFVPSEHTAVYAHDGNEGSLESLDRRGGGIASLLKAFATASGNMGGRVASNSAQYGLSRSISPSTSSSKPTPQHHSRRRRRQHPPQPRSLKERTLQRALSRPITHLESLEKRRKGKADRDASLFKSTAGAVGKMGGRVAGTAAQIGLLKTIIPPAPPPPLPVMRRAFSRPIPRAFKFAPFKAIKIAFNRTSRASARVYRNSAPARKKGKGRIYYAHEIED